MRAAITAGRLTAQIGGVISDNPQAYALQRLQGTGIPAVCCERRAFASAREFETALIRELEKYEVELVVLAGFMRLLSGYFIGRFRGRVMNIHPALLPAFPGLNAQAQALAYGAKVAGCTVHFVDEGMDSGPIILQAAVAVAEDDTPQSLSDRILQVEHVLYPRAVGLYCDGRLQIEGRRVKILGKEGV